MPQLLRTLTTAAEPAVEPDPPPHEPAPSGQAREIRYGGVDEDVTFEPPPS